jgi:hypothetical protein
MNEPNYTGAATDFYLASPEVAKIVNLAVALRRPILVEGEPGCGKTRLAYSIAAEKKLGDVVKITVKALPAPRISCTGSTPCGDCRTPRIRTTKRRNTSTPICRWGRSGRSSMAASGKWFC